MNWTILGSGGCAVIPKPLCFCRICEEARIKGTPYARTGPSSFLHDIHLLVDTPAESVHQLNRSRINHVRHLMFTHLDPDHTEGFRAVEQIALDFRTWQGYPEKRIALHLPERLVDPLKRIRSQYGALLDFYERSGFINVETFRDRVRIEDVEVIAIPVDRGRQTSYIYVFERAGRRVVYAPCDIKPFPEEREEVKDADLLVIQPGIFEEGLIDGFEYPPDHVSRSTLYTFEQTLELARQLKVKKTLFVHLEEYWNRSHDEYRDLEGQHETIRFAYDGMKVTV